MQALVNFFATLCAKNNSWLYFDKRAQALWNKPTLTDRDLCYVSSRDYRVWTPERYQDMMASFAQSLELSPRVSLLEVGCAAGYIARGLSALVGSYHGVDLAPSCLAVARRLRLPNATFVRGSGKTLPFADAAFDCTLSTDMFVNIADLTVCQALIGEMVRVTKPGGRIMIATMNDATQSPEAFAQRVQEYSATLPPMIEDPELVAEKWMPWHCKLVHRIRSRFFPPPQCAGATAHDPAFFVALARELNLGCQVLPVHRLHPYHGFRFSVLFRKGERLSLAA